MPTGSQQGRDINEANVVRQGLATAALQDGASSGDAATVGPDGELLFAAAGGGSLPAEWTVASDGSLTVAIADADGSIRLVRGSVEGARIVESVTNEGGGVEDASIGVTGIGGGSSFIQVTNGSVAGTAGTLDGRGQLEMFTETGVNALNAWNDVGNALRFALLKAGQPMIGVVAAPADGDLSPSQVALWFDDTDGGAKLKIKGKSANGTVVSGEVPLA